MLAKIIVFPLPTTHVEKGPEVDSSIDWGHTYEPGLPAHLQTDEDPIGRVVVDPRVVSAIANRQPDHVDASPRGSFLVGHGLIAKPA